MWVPGLIFGPLAIVAGVLLLIGPDTLARLLNAAVRKEDEEPGGYAPDLLKGPAIGLIWIGIGILALSLFAHPS